MNEIDILVSFRLLSFTFSSFSLIQFYQSYTIKHCISIINILSRQLLAVVFQSKYFAFAHNKLGNKVLDHTKYGKIYRKF